MCYRCEVCDRVTPHNVYRRVHVVYKNVPYTRIIGSVQETLTRKDIAREIVVCETCHAGLELGVPVDRLRRHAKPEAPIPVAKQEPVVVAPKAAPPVFRPIFLGRTVKVPKKGVE